MFVSEIPDIGEVTVIEMLKLLQVGDTLGIFSENIPHNTIWNAVFSRID